MSDPLMVSKYSLGKPSGDTKDVPVQAEGQEGGTVLIQSSVLSTTFTQRIATGIKTGKASCTANSCSILAPVHAPRPAQDLVAHPGVAR